MQRSRKTIVVLVSFCVGLWSYRYFISTCQQHASTQIDHSSQTALQNEKRAHVSEFTTTVERSPAEMLKVLYRFVAIGAEPNEVRKNLKTVRERLVADIDGRATKKILDELKTGNDATTGLNFVLNREGEISEWPTYRAFLLDALGDVDPVAAAKYSEVIFKEQRSAEEFVLALRNYTWGVEEVESQFLSQHVALLLQREDWAAKASSGFLEAIDFAALAGEPRLLKDLGRLISPVYPQAVQRAAEIGMTKIVSAHQASALRWMSHESDFLNEAPVVRGSLFARGEAQQKAELESYLLSANPTSAERAEFYQLFPLRSYVLTKSLANTNTTPSLTQMARNDAAALEMLHTWRVDSRFQQDWNAIDSAIERVQTYVQSATTAGILSSLEGQSHDS